MLKISKKPAKEPVHKPDKKEKPEKQPKPVKHLKHEKQQHTVINSLVGNLSSALEEDAGEIDSLLEEKLQPKEQASRVQKPARYRFFLIFGLFVFWLALIGAFSVVGTVREFTYDLINQTALKAEFERFIFPVVVTDPPMFTGTDNIQSSTVVASAVWKIIISGDNEIYERSMGMMTIPESDVEMAARSLFGSGFNINHRTIDYSLIAFEYDSEIKSYIVPETPVFFSFTPRIAGIAKEGEIYRVTVEYIVPTPMSLAREDYESESVKSMIYNISRNRDKSMTILSIEIDREHFGFYN